MNRVIKPSAIMPIAGLINLNWDDGKAPPPLRRLHPVRQRHDHRIAADAFDPASIQNPIGKGESALTPSVVTTGIFWMTR